MKLLKDSAPFLLLVAALLFVKVAVGESPTTWTTGTYEGTPAGSDLASTIDNNIRELKRTIRDYAETELCWGDASGDGCSTSNNGRLREGSARAFAEDTAPDGSTGMWVADRLSSEALDQGRIWVDTNTTPDNHLQVYNGGWEDVDGVPASDRTSWNTAAASVTEGLKAVRAIRTTDLDIYPGGGAASTCQTSPGGVELRVL